MSLYCKIKKNLGSFKLDIEFEAKDEVLALMGASGCGKSMTLKCIAGIVKPDSGLIILNDKTLFNSEKKINLSPQKRNVGMLFQDYALFPNMTVKQNIAMALKKSNYNDIENILSSYQLKNLENHYPYQLSGGQKQRCALARMMSSSPEITMLDEPFSALDSFLRWQLEQEVASAIKRFGKTVLLVSHNRDEVFRLCNRATIINNGINEPVRNKHELYSNPETYADALLTGCKNIYKAFVDTQTTYIPELGISFSIDKPIENICYAGIRSKQLIPAFMADKAENYVFFNYKIQNTIEDVFNYIFMVIPENGTSQIRWELPKANYKAVSENPPILAILKSNIMLLKE